MDDRGVLLLVEDDPDHAFLVRRQLGAHPEIRLAVVHVTTAAEATTRLAVGDVGCVVVDLSLPDASGLEAVHALRAVDPTVPVVVLTGLDSHDLGLQALQAGAQDYLVKGRHAADAVPRSVLFAIERARRHDAERHQAQLGRQLAMRDVQLSEAQRLARVGSWEWDVAACEVTWSDELLRLTGLREVSGVGSFDRYLALVVAEDRQAVAELFSSEAAARGAVTVRHRLVRPDGADRWVEGHMTASGWDDDLRPVRVIGTMQDVTQQKTTEERLQHQALHDSLTGLVNRGVLLDRLGRVLAAGRDDGSLVALVFLDLDQFKWVNDSHNHSTGDRLLVDVARRMERAVRPTDTLARFGGDEFVVLCERVDADQGVLEVVDRLRAALDEPFALDVDPDAAVVITASMGVATARPGSGEDPELLVRDADIAMYRAKERGRARYEIFDEGMRERAAARLQTQRDLSLALQRDELEVHFQPVVDLRTGTVTGSEALVRWRHPVRGLLGPDEFIPHAEQTGLVVALGAVVLSRACAVTAGWNRDRQQPLSVAVNLSARQLAHPQLADVVAEALIDSGLAPGLLCLEVTETVIMEDPEASALVLAQLRALGVRIAIDDFGTGYSSLAYLLSLPVDLLKIDRSFVDAIDAGGTGTAIVTAILALARTLLLGVVAEGVETPGQRRVLAAVGVTSAQGWLWGRPVPAHEALWAGLHGPMSVVGDVPAARRPRTIELGALEDVGDGASLLAERRRPQ